MVDQVCTSCRKGLSLEEIERGNFRHLAGRLYCAECVAKMRRVGPTLCAKCGTRDTPLYNGRTYLCRKCGAELPRAGQAAKPKPQASSRTKRPMKKCPYCGAVLPNEALKCRYCGSLLTREARDLEAVVRQNSQLRFWLGCFITASAFLLVFLIYGLFGKPRAQERQQTSRTAAAGAASAKARRQSPIKALAGKLDAVQQELALLKAKQERAEVAPLERGRVEALSRQISALRQEFSLLRLAHKRGVSPPPVKPELPRPAPPKSPKKSAPPPAKRPKAPPKPKSLHTPPVPTSVEPRITTPPPPEPQKRKTTSAGAQEPKVAAKTPEPPKAKGPTPAELAAAAYPAFAAKLKELRANRRYGEGFVACRQFLGNHLGTPAGERAAAQRKALRAELERVRDDHIRRFRQALDKGDEQAARRVVADLLRYDAPEIREDRERMLAEIKAAQEKPARDEANYLAQWETPADVKHLLRKLKNRDDVTERSNAAQQLARLGRRAALRGLIEALHDTDFYVVMCVIQALVDIGDPIALPYLVRLTKASFPGTYDPAAQACRSLAKAARDKYADAWKLIDTKKVGREIAEALMLPGKEESAVTSRFQIALVGTLALLDAKDAVPAIRSVLKSKDPAVRQAAAHAIKKLTGEDVLKELQPKPKAATPSKPVPKPKTTESAKKPQAKPKGKPPSKPAAKPKTQPKTKPEAKPKTASGA